MKHLNFLSTIGGTAMGLQSSDTGYRCRVVTDSLPSFCRVKMLRFISVLVLILTIGVGQMWGTDVTYELTISGTDFNTTSYAANNNEKTTEAVCTTDAKKKMDVSWTSNQVMKNSSNMQWQKNNGYIYNSTDLGTINSITVTSSAGSFTKYYGTSEHPTSGTTVGNGFFTVKVGNATGTTSSVVINFTISEGGGSTPSVTPTPTSLDWGMVLQGSSQPTKTITITGANLTAGTLTISATGGYSVTPTSKSVSGTLDATTLTVTPPSTSIAGAKNGKVTISGGGLASAVEVNLSMTVNAASTVTWMVNGSEYASTVVANGANPVFPSSPTSCDADKVFVGWTETNIGSTETNTAPSFITTATTISSAKTYYAVFAKRGAFTRVTSPSSLALGQELVIVSNKYNTAITTGIGYAAAPTESSSKVTPSEAMIWLLTGNSSDGWRISKPSNGYVLGASSSPSSNNSTTATLTSNNTYSTWGIGQNSYTSNVLYISYKTTVSCALEASSASSNWVVYNSSSYSSNQYCALRVYASSLTKYVTECCTPLGSVSGTVSLNQSGSDLVASGWGATTGGNETGYLVKLYNSDKSSVITSGNTVGTAKTYTFENPGAGTYWVSVTPTYSGAGNYCASGDETFSAASIDISGKVVITFKKNGATGTDDQTQEVDYNTETALEDVSARSYTAPSCKEFGGWANSEANATAGTVAYANGANITATEATTLWAIWNTKTYSVAQGSGTATGCSDGSFTFSPATVDCGGTVTITSSPDATHKGDPSISILPADAGTIVNNTITNVVKPITSISVSYAAKEAATVKLSVAGNESVVVSAGLEGDSYTLPSDAAECPDLGLYGWYKGEYSHATTAPSGDNFKTKGQTVTLTAGENKFYAVYATIGDPTNTYTKITTTGELETGDYLLVGYYSSNYIEAMQNAVSISDYMMEVNVKDYVNNTTTPTSVSLGSDNPTIRWRITKSPSSITIYNEAESKYFCGSTGTPALNTTSEDFSYSADGGNWTLVTNGKTVYYSNNWYVGTPSSAKPIYLFKRNASIVGPYTTDPNCTTHDLSYADPGTEGTIVLGKTVLGEGKTTTAEATPSAHYTFSHWTISGTDASLSDANANPVTVTMGTADATITAHFTEKEKCTVEFYNNGGDALSSTTYWLGETPVAPALTDGHDHDACDETSTTHYGWTQTAWTETLTKEQVDAKTAADVKVYAKAAALPAVAAGDNGKTIKYHAVWAKETDNSVSKNYTLSLTSSNFPSTYGGSWPNSGVVTANEVGGTGTLDVTLDGDDIGTYTNIQFKASSGYFYNTTDLGNITGITTNNASILYYRGTTENPSSGTSGGYFKIYNSTSNAKNTSSITINFTKTVGDISYSAFLTTCTPSHSVSSAVDPTGKATVTLGANSVAEGSTTTAEYSGITNGYEFVNWTISGTGASLSSTTDNPTTITMGTANVTVTANLQCVQPSFTAHPQSKTDYLTTGSATALSYTASAAGASLTQQWQVSNDNSSWDDIDGATSATYTPNIATEGTKYYRVVVTNSECDESKTSDVATITSTEPSGYCISLYNSNNNGIQSGFSNGGDGNEYTLSFTVPGKDGSDNWPMFWVGENNNSQSYSKNDYLANIKFTSSNATLGLAEGATGTLHIWDDNKASESNLWVKFEPDGYGFRWGGAGEWDQAVNTKAFTVDPGNANTYWTEMVTLDGTNNTTWNYYVGLQTASGYVYSGVDNEASDARGISRTRSMAGMKVSNGTAGSFKATYLDSEPTGTTGKFRIWNNNIEDYNFVCHFVPFYQLKYNANGGTGTMDPLPATPVSCEESAANRTVTVAANAFTAPTGKQFVKWNTAANGSGADVAEGAYELTGDVTLYAIWADADYTVTVNQSPDVSAETTGQTDAAHYNGTINLTTTVPSGYRFVNWTSSDVTITNPTSEDGASFTMPAQNVTVTANFQQIYTITWSANGVTTTSTVNAGNKLVLPVSEPTSCNAGYSTFIGWYSVAAGSAEEPSANVSGTKADANHTPTGNETWYAVWANGELVGGWQKTTSIAVGDVVIFVQETASKEMSNIALINTNMCGIATAYSTSPAGTYPLTIETGNGGIGYSFKTSANTYLSWSSNNTLTTSDTKNNASSWTISTSTDGNFKFANVATTERIMQFNNNSGQHRWACYGNDNQTAFQIYKQVAGATEFISNCCEEWTATAKYGESNVINVNDVVAVTVTGTVHGTASYESNDTDVLTVASDGKITGKKAGSATVTISWAGADGYCAYETTVDVTVNGTITVTYNKNDGSLTPETTSQNATSNSAFTLDANSFSRTGYSFQGWATTPSGDKEYNNSQADVEFAEDITLYAVWSINSHAVTLNQPTGNTIEATGAANLASVAYGTSITLSATENDGYVFTGWSTEDVDLANTNPVVFTMPDNDVTVTATYSTYNWIAADLRYTVTTAPKISYTKVEKFSTAGVVIKENFKRSDDNTITKQETYGGAWTAKLNGVAIANGADLSLEDNGKTLKLYIGEEEIASYTLTVSDVDADQFIDGLWSETFDVQTGTYDMPTPSAHAAGATDCAKHNTFAGWVLAANAENPTEDDLITGAAATGVTAANNTYYAVWSKSENVNKEFTVSKTGFASSEISSGTISTGITYTTQKNGGSTDPAQSGTSLRLYQIKSGNSDGNSITISGSSGVTLTKVEFTTTGSDYGYVTNSYTWNNPSVLTSGTVADGKITLEDLSTDKLTVVNMATSSSYRLDISKIEVTYEKEVTEVDYITDCDPRYDVEFLAGDDATGSYDKVTKKAGVVITLPDGSALSKDHHSFDKWYSASYGTYFEGGASYTVPVDGDLLEAQWLEDHFGTVTFKNGETTTSTIKVYDGGTYDLAAALVQAGKEFIGWKWDGSIYTAGQQNQHMPATAEDRTYTAVWMPVIDVATADAADLSDGKWILVEKKSQLKAGDFIVIAAAGDNAALSNYQKTSNRGDAAVTKNNDTLTCTSTVAPLFLQYDPENDYYAFYDRAYTTNTEVAPSQKGYLYAPNALKTQSNITMQGIWAIDIADKKASIVAQGKNDDKIMRYNKGSNLFNCYGTATQSDIAIYKWAKNISGNVNVSDLALTDAVIVKDGATLTIDAAATLDNVVVEVGGKVSNTNNLTVNNLTIKSEAGKSGQVTDGSKIIVNGDLYMDVTFFKGATTLDAETANRWYMISAPFDVNLNGGFMLTDGTPMICGTGDGANVFDLFEYNGTKRAETGVTGWKRAQGKMPAGTTCLIGFNAGQPTTIRLKAASREIEEKTSITLEAFAGDATNQNWNGVANPTLHYTNINHDVQTYNNEDGANGRKYIPYSASSTSFVVGTAFFVQATGQIDLSAASHSTLRAPQRENERYEACVQIFRQGATEFADQMYVRASESALNEYEQGHDMITWNGTTGNTAMIWAENYGKRLAIEEAPLVNNKASYELGIFAPTAGTYSISVAAPQENAELYLTKNGHIIWNLTMSPCELELTQGQNNEYGLMLRANVPSVSTGVDEVTGDELQVTDAQKIIIDEKVFILRGGKMYDVTGKEVR